MHTQGTHTYTFARPFYCLRPLQKKVTHADVIVNDSRETSTKAANCVIHSEATAAGRSRQRGRGRERGRESVGEEKEREMEREVRGEKAAREKHACISFIKMSKRVPRESGRKIVCCA